MKAKPSLAANVIVLVRQQLHWATRMEKHPPLGILPVPWQVGQMGQVSPAGAPFMDPYGGKCFSAFTFSISGVGSSGVDRTIPYLQGGKWRRRRAEQLKTSIKARFYG